MRTTRPPGHTTPEDRKHTRWMKRQNYLKHRLKELFTKKEFVTYENLPEKLRKQVRPFEEFTFP